MKGTIMRNINRYRAQAEGLRSAIQLRAAMEATNDNPYHAMHIMEFCDYADQVVAAAMEDLRQSMMEWTKEEIMKSQMTADVKVDENSLKSAITKIDNIFHNIFKAGR